MAKLIRFPEGVMSLAAWVQNHAVRVECVEVPWTSLINRRAFNRMDYSEQKAYEARLRTKTTQYRAWSSRDTFYTITKTLYLAATKK